MAMVFRLPAPPSGPNSGLGRSAPVSLLLRRLYHQLLNRAFNHPVVRLAVDLPLGKIALLAVGFAAPAEGHVRREVDGAGRFDVPVVAQAADGEENGGLVGDVAVLRLAAEPEGIAHADRVVVGERFE